MPEGTRHAHQLHPAKDVREPDAYSGKEGGQDKRPCHECRKSLTGLANSRAGRSVGGRKGGILSHYQCAALHSGTKQPLHAAP